MTLELIALLIIAFLAASLWIPYVVGINTMPSHANASDNFIVPPDPLKMTPWVARAYRAHQNLLEQAFPFCVAVLLAHVLNVSSLAIEIAAISFVLLRIVHAVGMITSWARMPVRPLVFTGGYIAILVILWEIVRLSV